MKLAIMQPYFFPYLGYFDLINVVDHFVIYDSVQYIKQGWINRNRVHRLTGGWQYITVPVDRSSFHNSYRTPIRDIQASKGDSWKARIIGQLDHYRKSAPFYWETISLVRSCLDIEGRGITQLDAGILEKVCSVLDIEFRHSFSSQMDLTPDPSLTPLEKVLAICEHLGASEYVNLPGGKDLYDEQPFKERGIDIEFRDTPALSYPCGAYEFIPNLSIIDVLMWNAPKIIKEHLEKHR